MALSTIERVLFLRGVELFGQIPGEDLVHVAQVCEEVHFDAGTQFITQGDMGDCLYILVDGEVDIAIEGVGVILHRVSKNIIGEMAIISRNPRSAHCIAKTDMTALKIGYDVFWNLMEEKPILALGVMRVLSQRLDEANKNLRRLGASQ
ncbi:MAG: cyclic nucleotide-binding domain-containing protein [Ardenticatenaceae bacterium]|nr:cyclic nucleotide-binding domain-containing protein [Ardenticatenaceae bacterium]